MSGERRRFHRPSLALLAAAASTAGAWPAAAQTTSAAPGTEYVLVPRDRPVFAHPDPHAPNARDAEGDRYAVRLGPYWVYRFVAEQAGWTEIESTDDANRCYGVPSGLSGLGVRLFVPSADLGRVIVRPVSRTFADGTSVALRPGVGVVAARGAVARAVVSGLAFDVALERDDVGRRYATAPFSRAAPAVTGTLSAGADLRIDRTTRVQIDDAAPAPRGVTSAADRRADAAAAVLEGLLVSPTTPMPASFDTPSPVVLAYADATNGARPARVQVRTACVDLTAVYTPHPSAAPTSMGALLAGSRSVRVRAHVVLYWPDGTPAGETRTTVATSHPPSSDGSGRSCFDQDLRQRLGSAARPVMGTSLRMCVDDGAIEP